MFNFLEIRQSRVDYVFAILTFAAVVLNIILEGLKILYYSFYIK